MIIELLDINMPSVLQKNCRVVQKGGTSENSRYGESKVESNQAVQTTFINVNIAEASNKKS